MPRLPITALVFAAACAAAGVLGAPQTAAAQDCLCVMPGQVPTGWLDAPTSPRVPQSIEVGPVFSSDGELLVSDDVSARSGELGRTDRPASPVGEVLWCLSSDDPRCAPRDEAPGDGPHVYDASRGAATEAERPRLPQPDAVDGRAPAAIGGERAGIHARLERPPQA